MAETHKIGEAGLYALFRAHGIAYEHFAHAPMMTVEDSRAIRGEMPGAHVKNMFLKEKKGGLWLVTCLEDRQVRIRDLEREIGAKGCSFGKPELLWETLGVRPGAVTPFALANDRGGAVRFVMDDGIERFDAINAHPMHNEASTTVALTDLWRFLEVTGHAPLMVDFDRLEALGRERASAEGGAA